MLTRIASTSAGTCPGARQLPGETWAIMEMLSVLNVRIPLAQLGQAAEIDSPSAAIEPAVASGLLDWWPQEPTCPVQIRHQHVREAIYSGISPGRRRRLHTRAVSVVSESMSWAHRVAALDRPDEGLAAELERLAAGEAADGRRAEAATHLRWASDISPVPGDRERRLLTAAQQLVLAGDGDDPGLQRAVEAAAPSARRSYVLGLLAYSAGRLAEAEHRLSQALTQARAEPGSRPLAALIARELAGAQVLLGHGQQAAARGQLAPVPPVRPLALADREPALTGRETEVAQLVGTGLSNPEIAAELFISRKAVEFHLSNVYAKCGLKGRQQLRRLVRQRSSWGDELGSFSRDCGRWRADSGSIGA